MWFELHWGTDCWCLVGLCQGAPQVMKTGNPKGNINPFKSKSHFVFDILIKVIVITRMQMFCWLNWNNAPFGYVLLDGIMTHLDTYQLMEAHIFWPFWIPTTFKIHLNGYCKSGPILVDTFVLTTITWEPTLGNSISYVEMYVWA